MKNKQYKQQLFHRSFSDSFAKGAASNGNNTRLKPVQWVIIFLSIALALNLAIFIFSIVESNTNYRASETTLLYYLEESRYPRLRKQLADYSQKEIDNSETLTELYHVSLYYENTVFYYAFLEIDPAQAEEYHAAAQESATQMGRLSQQQALIDGLFAEQYNKG